MLAEELLELSPVVVRAERVAHLEPAGTYAAPVTELRFEPSVDLQSRNIAEAQADCSIRGGIFSQTGFRAGALTLLDPQTGHYSAEIPVSPAMLTAPGILTGLDNGFSGFNASAGTVVYEWKPIETGGEVRGGVGDHRLNLQHGYAAYLAEPPEFLTGLVEKIGIDLDLARALGDGTRPTGDYDFQRYSGRVQFQGERYRSDLFCGYQAKFFGWPDMYTPEEFFPTDETESLFTTLVMLNHRITYSEENLLEVSGYYRRNNDHYILQRDNPELYQAFHRTTVWSAGLNGRHDFGLLAVNYSGQVTADELTSTTLTYSPYYSRTIGKLSVLPEKTFALATDLDLRLRCGASLDDSNRAGSALTPLAGVTVIQHLPGQGENRYYISSAGSSQLPGYIAIGSPPAGLFGGNPDLGRERSRQVEAGVDLSRTSWGAHAAVFYRVDDDLVDWTYSQERPNARTANEVDIDAWGGEVVISKSWEYLRVAAGYTCLKKSSDYKAPDVDASFYALNYPRHRVTCAIVFRFLDRFEIRSDNEYRVQEPNSLRHGRRDAVLSYLSLSYLPHCLPGMELTASIDNPFKVSFEEIPGVPGPGRQFAVTVAYRW